MAGSMGVKKLHVYNDSQLMVKQVNAEYQAKRANMISYFAKVKELLKKFEKCHITKIMKVENVNANSLTKLVSVLKSELTPILIEMLKWPSILEEEKEMNPVEVMQDGRMPLQGT